MIEPKQRPMANASAGPSVWPTMPRMSYSRSEVGSKSCRNAMVSPARSVIVWQEGAHRGREIGPLQREGDLRFQKADFIAAIETPALIAQAMERLLADHFRHAVGQLNFVAGAALQRFQMADYFRHQNIAADDRQRRRRVFRRRLFHEAQYFDQPPVIRAGPQNAV